MLNKQCKSKNEAEEIHHCQSYSKQYSKDFSRWSLFIKKLFINKKFEKYVPICFNAKGCNLLIYIWDGVCFACKVQNPCGTVQLYISFCPISREKEWIAFRVESQNLMESRCETRTEPLESYKPM